MVGKGTTYQYNFSSSWPKSGIAKAKKVTKKKEITIRKTDSKNK